MKRELRFPEEEKYSWLPMLLDSYAVFDLGVSRAIKKEKSLKKAEIACAKGCSECCRTHKDIPVYPIERVGLIWYVTEKVGWPVRDILKKQLLEHRPDGHCPFLTDAVCAVHPLRPSACRAFNVFGTPCAPGEDPYFSRREDVLTPIKSYMDDSLMHTMPFYGITTKDEKISAVKENTLYTQVRTLHDFPWHEAGLKMTEFDSRTRHQE